MSDREAREPRDADQHELERRSRSGGDAEAAGSPAEREAIARDEDDTWSDTDDGGGATGER